MADPIGEGVYVALATPLDEAGRVAVPVLERLVDKVIADGVTGIAMLGSTGEAASLTDEARRVVQDHVVERAAGRVALISGVNDTVLARVLDQLDQAAARGVQAALVPLPSYYPPTPSEMARYYTLLAERSPLPIILYNIPPYTKVGIPPVVVGELAAHPRIIGIKDSGGQFLYLAEVIQTTAGKAFRVFTGSDEMLLASLAIGAHGTICASANVVAPLSVGILRAWRAGDLARARVLQEHLLAMVDACRRRGAFRAWKGLLEETGFAPCRVQAPYEDLPPAEREPLRALLETLPLAEARG
jgi:dihydrodipicolinate synthase/N-acetylneuraminate lyase